MLSGRMIPIHTGQDFRTALCFSNLRGGIETILGEAHEAYMYIDGTSGSYPLSQTMVMRRLLLPKLG